VLEQIKHKIKQQLASKIKNFDFVIEEPKKGYADIAIPLFSYAKETGMPMKETFDTIKTYLLDLKEIDNIAFVGGFLNVFIERIIFSKTVLEHILTKKEEYGNKTQATQKVVVMDYSSPNIAKSFSVGHLRSTMIGHSLNKIYQKLGYKVISVNHLGDWGTQFGKMIVAYQKWGKEELIKENPIAELQNLYVRFHDEAKNDPTLEQQGRNAFLKLEEGDSEALRLWNWFKDESLRKFMEMYDLLGVSFDYNDGESFYNDKMDQVVLELEEKGLLKFDQGAQIVELGEDVPPALIKRKDGATLYATRDLAALFYRFKTYHADKILYVVGNEQKLYFEQLKLVTEKMGYGFDIEHVNFGLVLLDGKKMSTRGGKGKSLESVIEQAVLTAKEAIVEKNPNLENQDEVAKAVGIGAIIFNDLKNERHLNIDFNLKNMLKFEGQTGPYLQYSSVRMSSVLNNQTLNDKIDLNSFKEDDYFGIVKLLAQYPHIVKRAEEQNAPSVIAKYTLQLAQEFNRFYGKYKIICEDEILRQTNLKLTQAIQYILNDALGLLGIKVLKQM